MDDLPIIDRRRLELITRGNTGRAGEFLDALLEEAAEIAGRLTTLLAGTDRVAVADAAHTVKGMAAEVGALRLRAAAAALEAEGESPRWPERVDVLNAALDELRSHVHAGTPPAEGSP